MPPKVISEYERTRTRQAIITHTKKLISLKKGIKNITVDDIIGSVGIGKGSFYSYFPSKEACIYEVIKQAYKTDLEQFKIIMGGELSLKERIEKFLWDVFLAEDAIDRYMSTQDFEMVLRKLPPEYSECDIQANKATVVGMMELFDFDRVRCESLAAFLDCISYVVKQTDISREAQIETLGILVQTVAEYVEAHSKVIDNSAR